MRTIVLTTAAAAGAAHAADANNGKTIFGRCAVCHTVTRAAATGWGPICSASRAARPRTADYMYSGALKNSGITWTTTS